MNYRRELKEGEVYLPITFQQFEALTNEMLIPINEMTAPQAVDGNFMAKVIMSVVHGLDKKSTIVTKQELFDRSINLISNQVTHQAVQLMMEELLKKSGKDLESIPTLDEEDEIIETPI